MSKEEYPTITDYPEESTDEVINVEEDVTVGEDFSTSDWPVYLSLGAICITLLLIIIMNIASHRKK